MFLDMMVTFLGMIALDFIWGFYTRRITEGRALHASLYALFITALNGIVVINFVREPALLVAAMAGAFIGTYLSVKIDHKEEN